MTDRVDALLADAVSAARYRASEGASDGATTRLRLRESLAGGGARRKRRLTIIAAVIASLFGSTAFAFIAGWRPIGDESPSPQPALTTTPVPPSATSSPRTRARSTAASTTEPPAPAVERAAVVAPTAAAPTTVAPTTVAPPAPSSVPHAPTTRASAATTKPSIDDTRSGELAAYRVAHEAHFRGTDPARALGAWDAYLARYPDGQLAPEARYDRAVVLIKLRRIDEAKAALVPFASAPVGSYRQREAAKLLAAISR